MLVSVVVVDMVLTMKEEDFLPSCAGADCGISICTECYEADNCNLPRGQSALHDMRKLFPPIFDPEDQDEDQDETDDKEEKTTPSQRTQESSTRQSDAQQPERPNNAKNEECEECMRAVCCCLCATLLVIFVGAALPQQSATQAPAAPVYNAAQAPVSFENSSVLHG